ncbi:anion permease [Halobacteriales archaeon QS_1_68_20]|nr:MAG: anion permease [Halobacteriales archaeon QS_1_68_20]
MVEAGTAITLAVAGLASLFMAWTIGAGSSGSTPFAPAVGANAISIMRAGFVVGILGFLGAVLQGANVSEAVGNELVRGVELSAEAAIAALLVAAVLVAIGVFTGYPIATAFTVTGAVVGVGLAIGGVPAWGKYQQIAALWIGTPFVGGGAAYVTARLLADERAPERAVVPALAGLVGLLVANVEFAVLGADGEGATPATAAARAIGGPEVAVSVVVSLAFAAAVALVMARELRVNLARGQRRFLLALGGLVAFSAGGTQVGLAVGPLLPLLDPSSVGLAVPTVALLTFGGAGLLIGSWTGAPRLIKALSQDYSSLGPRRSIAALIPAFAIAQTAVLFGIPVSFNEIIVSTIVGAGYAGATARNGAGVSAAKMGYTVLAWIGSLTVAGVAGYALMSLL